MEKIITAMLIGTGRRDLTFNGVYALKNRDKLKLVAVAKHIEKGSRRRISING